MVATSKSGKASNGMTFIDPLELQSLSPETVILVNRIALNRQRVSITMMTHGEPRRAAAIIYQAKRDIRSIDKLDRRPCFGAKMKVSDAQIIFVDMSCLPKNTFAIARS